MPSIASHFACAKLVSDSLHIDDPNFYKGNILPDIIDEVDSHHKINGKFYLIPDIEYFINNLNLNNNLYLGYLCHLLLDKYFLEEYVPNNIKNHQEIDIFTYELIYNDYTIINRILIEQFGLDLNYLNQIMSNINEQIDNRKYQSNLNHINNPKINEPLTCIDIEKYILFLKEISKRIASELKVLRRVKEKK